MVWVPGQHYDIIYRNFRQEKIFATCYANLLSCVKDCIENMATFTALANIFSANFFCSANVAGLGLEKLLSRETFTCTVMDAVN